MYVHYIAIHSTVQYSTYMYVHCTAIHTVQYSTVHMCMCACVLTEETCPPTQFKASLSLPIVQATEAWHFVFANSATTVKCTVQVYVMHNTSCVQHTYM